MYSSLIDDSILNYITKSIIVLTFGIFYLFIQTSRKRINENLKKFKQQYLQ